MISANLILAKEQGIYFNTNCIGIMTARRNMQHKIIKIKLRIIGYITVEHIGIQLSDLFYLKSSYKQDP